MHQKGGLYMKEQIFLKEKMELWKQTYGEKLVAELIEVYNPNAKRLFEEIEKGAFLRGPQSYSFHHFIKELDSILEMLSHSETKEVQRYLQWRREASKKIKVIYTEKDFYTSPEKVVGLYDIYANLGEATLDEFLLEEQQLHRENYQLLLDIYGKDLKHPVDKRTIADPKRLKLLNQTEHRLKILEEAITKPLFSFYAQIPREIIWGFIHKQKESPFYQYTKLVPLLGEDLTKDPDRLEGMNRYYFYSLRIRLSDYYKWQRNKKERAKNIFELNASYGSEEDIRKVLDVMKTSSFAYSGLIQKLGADYHNPVPREEQTTAFLQTTRKYLKKLQSNPNYFETQPRKKLTIFQAIKEADNKDIRLILSYMKYHDLNFRSELESLGANYLKQLFYEDEINPLLTQVRTYLKQLSNELAYLKEQPSETTVFQVGKKVSNEVILLILNYMASKNTIYQEVIQQLGPSYDGVLPQTAEGKQFLFAFKCYLGKWQTDPTFFKSNNLPVSGSYNPSLINSSIEMIHLSVPLFFQEYFQEATPKLVEELMTKIPSATSLITTLYYGFFNGLIELELSVEEYQVARQCGEQMIQLVRQGKKEAGIKQKQLQIYPAKKNHIL